MYYYLSYYHVLLASLDAFLYTYIFSLESFALRTMFLRILTQRALHFVWLLYKNKMALTKRATKWTSTINAII